MSRTNLHGSSYMLYMILSLIFLIIHNKAILLSGFVRIYACCSSFKMYITSISFNEAFSLIKRY